MSEAYAELEKLPEDATSLEKSNLLIKLRESLTDEEKNGVSVTIPDGISVYPNNVLYFWWGLFSGIFCFGFWMATFVAWMEDWD